MIKPRRKIITDNTYFILCFMTNHLILCCYLIVSRYAISDCIFFRCLTVQNIHINLVGKKQNMKRFYPTLSIASKFEILLYKILFLKHCFYKTSKIDNISRFAFSYSLNTLSLKSALSQVGLYQIHPIK